MLTITEVIPNSTTINEGELALISDKLWQIGCLEEIKEKVSPDLFYLHIGINVIGGWKMEGWWYIICEQADFVPYIPKTLEKLQLPQIKAAFEEVISMFPEYTVFKSDDAGYYDICNFLQSAGIKVQDERLKSISSEERRAMVKQTRKKLDALEELTEAFWSESAQCEGWKQILDYIKR